MMGRQPSSAFPGQFRVHQPNPTFHSARHAEPTSTTFPRPPLCAAELIRQTLQPATLVHNPHPHCSTMVPERAPSATQRPPPAELQIAWRRSQGELSRIGPWDRRGALTHTRVSVRAKSDVVGTVPYGPSDATPETFHPLWGRRSPMNDHPLKIFYVPTLTLPIFICYSVRPLLSSLCRGHGLRPLGRSVQATVEWIASHEKLAAEKTFGARLTWPLKSCYHTLRLAAHMANANETSGRYLHSGYSQAGSFACLLFEN